jgi:hypothetical protein
MKLPRVYPILDTATLESRGFGITRAAKAFLDGGAGILQLRHKQHWSRAAELFDVISVSAGVRGTQILLSPACYLAAVEGVVGAITRSKQ